VKIFGRPEFRGCRNDREDISGSVPGPYPEINHQAAMSKLKDTETNHDQKFSMKNVLIWIGIFNIFH